jgi:hypothetical protein
MLQEYGYNLHRLKKDGGLRRAKVKEIKDVTLENWVAVYS